MRFELIAADLPQILPEVLGRPVQISSIEREPTTPHDDQPWLTVKYGPAEGDDVHGVTRIRVIEDDGALNLIAKVNPVHGIGETLIPWICRTYDITLPHPYPIYHSAREVVGTGAREANLYELSVTLPELLALLPPYFGTIVAGGERAIILGDEGPIRGLDAGGANRTWNPSDVDSALRAIGAVHAASAAVVTEIPWLPPRPDTETMAGDADLWRGLLDAAAQRVPEIVTPEVFERRAALIDSIDIWHPYKDAMPTVIAHNDFNPRNVGFLSDGRVVALDWELVRRDSPQRDVAEMLTFVLDETADLAVVRAHADQHREALAATGLRIAAAEYYAGLAADLRSEAIDRMGMQLLFEAAFDLPYVPRINATVDHLVEITTPWLT